MFIEVLPKDRPRHLDALSRSGLLRPFYLYPLLDQPIHDLGIDIAGLRDIACMNVHRAKGAEEL